MHGSDWARDTAMLKHFNEDCDKNLERISHGRETPEPFHFCLFFNLSRLCNQSSNLRSCDDELLSLARVTLKQMPPSVVSCLTTLSNDWAFLTDIKHFKGYIIVHCPLGCFFSSTNRNVSLLMRSLLFYSHKIFLNEHFTRVLSHLIHAWGSD